jgi:uncharacterized hydrophobic protein (TIGR00271 family)
VFNSYDRSGESKEMLKKWLQPLGRERKAEVLEELGQDSSPGFDYFVLVLLSCSIATFGLITNSTAVIIGAMLVAPLMSPILGLSLASVVAEERLFERAVLALVEGIGLAIAVSAFLGWLAKILPFDLLTQLPTEVTLRAHPTPFDLGIALAGGAAAAYALANPRLSAALPGVAIATALMPPLCSVGIGLATSNWSVALGAMLLFITNLLAISLAGILVFVLLGFRPRSRQKQWHRIPQSLVVSALLVLAVTIPLVILSLRIVDEARFTKTVQDTVQSAVGVFPDAEILDVSMNQTDTVLDLKVTVLTTRQPVYDEVVSLQQEIALRLNQPVALQLIVVPGRNLDPLVPPTRTPTMKATNTFTSTSTRTPTPTFTPTPTNTPTSTLTFTPTPVLAYIANTGGKGVYVYDEAGGKAIKALPENMPIFILYRRSSVNGLTWLEIRTADGEVGWVPANYVNIKP